MNVKDFSPIGPIGRGGYGNVSLVRHLETSDIFAMKKMRKTTLKAKNQLVHVQTERDIMVQIVNNPWLVQLFYSFQDENYLYLVMEFVPGGDLRTLISNVGPFNENESKFYVAEMIIAVGCLHDMGYIHRDLKPDNFLVDRKGHLKLADFGLSKSGLKDVFTNTIQLPKSDTFTFAPKTKEEFVRRSQNYRKSRKQLAFSVVGSPDYMAYELLIGEGYDFAVDWWSIGVICFELLTGLPPFFADTPLEVFMNIQNYQKCLDDLQQTIEPVDKITMTPVCWEFLRSLMCEPKKRLGRGGPDEILDHRFFDDIDWRIRQIKPPFIPNLASEMDLKYFDYKDDEGDELKKTSSENPPNAEDKSSKSPRTEKLKGFTFKRGDSAKLKP
jgi:serine/threonine protein kinase